MTADAKVGLLLGLFFIVLIAFLINGLPNFIKDREPEHIQTVTITPPTAPDMPLDNHVDRAIEQLRPVPLRPRITEPPREVVILDAPESQVSVPERIVYENEQTSPVRIVEEPATIQTPEVVQKKKIVIHVVQSGENLPMIARKYYGAEEGNRHVIINKLYEYNADVLKSADLVYVGDKLKVPPLIQLVNPEKSPVTSPQASETLLKKFSNMFERVSGSNAAFVSEYIVQEDESLWSIAEKTLGDGKRYSEIARLNKLRNPDQVVTGMSLKIPTQ